MDKSQFLETFLDEAQSYLTDLNQGILNLESHSFKSEKVIELFRTAHTLKGASRMMGLEHIQSLAHDLEDFFDNYKNKQRELKKEEYDLLFSKVDAIEKSLKSLSSKNKNDIQNISEDIEKVQKLCDEKFSHKIDSDFVDSDKENQEFDKLDEVKDEYLRIPLSRINNLLNLMGEVVVNSVKSSYKVNLLKKLSKQTFILERMLFDLDSKIKEIFSVSDELILSKGSYLRASKEMQQAAELLAYLHQIEASFEHFRENIQSLSDDFQTESFHLQPLMQEIQQKMKEMRMLPCSTIFEAFPRMVRDLASEQGKDIEFKIEGETTEIDKKVLEKLKGPLIHLLRNAVDHGIEKSCDRKDKDPKAKLLLKAFQQGGKTFIQVHDDGAGLDEDKIKKKIIEKKILSERELQSKSRDEVLNMVFHPGFSTSDIITDVSGRGVGLDVVRHEIEYLKGQIRVETEKGQGSLFQIELPLSISIMHVLMVQSAGMKWAIPMTNLQESLLLNKEDVIEVSGRKIIRLDNESIPLVSMVNCLGFMEKESRKPAQNAIVIRSLESRVCFIVDQVIGEEEVFVKSLGQFLSKTPGVSGGTILPNGEIVIILDAQSLISLSENFSTELPVRSEKNKKEKIRVLVVEDSLTTRELEKTILEKKGYDVMTAIDGLDAMEKLNYNNFDIIVSDIQMPRMDGFEFCSNLRMNEQFKNLPLIFVTALSKEIEKRKGIEVGAQAYIIKNQFDQGNLIDTIERLV